MKHLTSHIAFALRMMAKTPAITVLSVLVLAIGIAGVSSIFNIIEAIALRDLPYQDAERLLSVYRADPRTPQDNRRWPMRDYRELREQLTSVSDVCGMVLTSHAIDFGSNSSVSVNGGYLEWDFVQMLGVEPMRGRAFTREDAEPNAQPVVLISHRTWVEELGADENLIGRKTIKVDGVLRTVVVVMPEGFDFPFNEHIWSPLCLETVYDLMGWSPDLYVLVQARPGHDPEQVAADVSSVLSRLETTYPDSNKGITMPVVRTLKEEFINDETMALFMSMFACSILVLLMACGIVTNLVMAQASRRTQEIAIRGALGASRSQIVGQIMTESALISILGVFVGWVFRSWFENGVLYSYYEEFNIPDWMTIQRTGIWHLVMVAGVLVISTVGSSLMPALRATRGDLNQLLRDSSRTGSSLRLSRMGKFLIVWQIATACAILTGGGIIAHTLQKARSDSTLYDSDQYLYAHVAIKAGRYTDNRARAEYFERLLQRLENDPDVKTVVLSNEGLWGYNRKALEIEGKVYTAPGDRPAAFERVVSRDYFTRLGIPMLRGRDFNRMDTVDAPDVAIVCEPFAKLHWGNDDPIGKRFRVGDSDQWFTVVGVVPEAFDGAFVADHVSGYYIPEGQEAWMDMGVHAQGFGEPTALESLVRRAVADIDPEARVDDISNLTHQLERGLLFFDFLLTIFLVFAGGALVMTAAGLFGVIAFSASQRKREIGIRMALGARPLLVALMLFRQGLFNIGIGLLFGALGAWILRGQLQGFFVGQGIPFYESIQMYTVFLSSLLIVALLAIWLPSLRGSQTQPSEALRID